MMQQAMSTQDQVGAQQMLQSQIQQQAMVQPQQTIIQSQHGMVQSQNGTMQPQHGMVQSQHVSMQPQHGMVQSQNGTIQTQQGMIQTQQGMIQPQHGMVQSHHGLVQPHLVPQQMMLCPVRVVYDTPMMIQQGDQLQQPHQNFFVNPQSTPPWARPIQNQFIYVQQMPSNNLVPVQQLDPNQMYIQQNFQNYQQVIPQMMSQNPQEQIRMIPNMVPNAMVPNSMSVMNNLPNNMVSHMVQNGIVQNNIGNMVPNNVVPNNSMTTSAAQNNVMTNVLSSAVPTNTNTTQVVTSGNMIPTSVTYSVQGNVQNVQNVATTMQHTQRPMQTNSEVNTSNANQQQVVSTENRQVINQNNISNQKSVGLQTQAYRTIPMNSIRTPIPIINQIQNVTNTPNVQNNIRQIIPNQTVTSISQNIPKGNEIKVAATHTNTDNTVTYSAVRNGQPYTFRAIQPKPTQYRQFAPMTQMQRPNLNTKYIVPNVQNYTRPNIPVTNAKTETNNTNVNRKRKSESPDEIQKKVATNSTVYGSMTVTAKTKDKIIAKAMNTSEIGTNTSPVHKRDDKKANSQYPMLQINPMEAKVKNNDQKSNIPQLIRISQEENTPTDTTEQTNEEKMKQLMEKEKLIRNTVFSQARGRVLNDKVDMPNNVVTSDENVNIIAIANPIVAKVDNSMQTEKLQTRTKVENTENVQKNAILRELLSKTSDTSKINELNSNLNIDETITKVNEFVTKLVNEKLSKSTETLKNTQNKVDNDTKSAIGAESSKDAKAALKSDTVKSKEICKNDVKEPKINEQSKTNKSLSNKKEENPTKITVKTAAANEVKVNTSKTNETVKNEDQNVKKEKEYKNISANDINGKEIHMVDGTIVKEEKNFVLTHVLDGYVIQESNVPFAIRKPLKERTINMLIEEKQDSTPLSKEGTSEETASTSDNDTIENIELVVDGEEKKENVEVKPDKEIKENILEISQLNLNELEAGIKKEEAMKEEGKKIMDRIDKENPFADLKSTVVKAWTAEELSLHLEKYNWIETISILREHEIDGESLLLVSASQLAHIGVSETHANLICEFVNNKER